MGAASCAGCAAGVLGGRQRLSLHTGSCVGRPPVHPLANSAGLPQATLGRMGEKCDAAIYYARVRLPMSGWRNNPALPEGLVYEGQFGGQVRAGMCLLPLHASCFTR